MIQRTTESAPEVWRILCRNLNLAPALAHRWWGALTASPALCCTSTRQCVLLADAGTMPHRPAPPDGSAPVVPVVDRND